MDFHTLLYQAQKNNAKDKEIKYFKASLDPPKKETKEGRQLSDSIKKFLAKKEEEDRQKQLEEQKKKEELLSLRSQDRKSFKRVQSMLNRTKSANKSVIEDAKDDVNTSVTMADNTVSTPTITEGMQHLSQIRKVLSYVENTEEILGYVYKIETFLAEMHC